MTFNARGTKVLIVDDHPVVRQGLGAVLRTQPDFEIVGEAQDGGKAVEIARKSKPDVVLMDVAMPVCDGASATRRIVRFLPECKVLALSCYTDEKSVQRMLRAGVAGYLSKQAAPDELINGIRTVTAGKRRFFSSDIELAVCRPRQACNHGHGRDTSLTERDGQVLKLIADGLTNRMIATELQVSPSEVKRCRERVINKLNIRNVAELTRYAIAHGFVAVQESPMG